MSRLRKASRLWRPEASDAAAHALVGQDALVCTIDPAAIFERRAPLEIELGAGRGDFILDYARSHPDRNFLAVELSGTISRLLAVRCGRSGLANLRVARMDARTLVNLMLPGASVAAFHIYFPDPWPKERHAKHRLFTPFLVRNLLRTLDPAGRIYAASDVEGWAAEMFSMLEGGGFVRVAEEPPGAARSGFARKYLAQGKAVFGASFAPASLKRGLRAPGA